MDTSVLEFGKFRGHTYLDIITNNKNYALWCLDNLSQPTKAQKEFCNYVRENLPDEIDQIETQTKSKPKTNKKYDSNIGFEVVKLNYKPPVSDGKIDIRKVDIVGKKR